MQTSPANSLLTLIMKNYETNKRTAREERSEEARTYIERRLSGLERRSPKIQISQKAYLSSSDISLLLLQEYDEKER